MLIEGGFIFLVSADSCLNSMKTDFLRDQLRFNSFPEFVRFRSFFSVVMLTTLNVNIGRNKKLDDTFVSKLLYSKDGSLVYQLFLVLAVIRDIIAREKISTCVQANLMHFASQKTRLREQGAHRGWNLKEETNEQTNYAPK